MMFLVQIIFNMLDGAKLRSVDAEIDQWNAERGLIKDEITDRG